LAADHFEISSATQEGLMTKRITTVTAMLAAAGFLATSSGAFAQSPTQADFDACNAEAKTAVSSPSTAGSSGSASPSTTGSGTSTTTSGGVGGRSSDKSLQGLAAGQSDPAVQQAYRDCMKRRGF
jgi:hypothetical protein